MAPPKPGEWLSQHGEPGQTFEQYLKSNPILPTANRRTIYIQPLGDFGAKQREVISLTAEYIGIYLNLPVKTFGDMPLSAIPDEARRVRSPRRSGDHCFRRSSAAIWIRLPPVSFNTAIGIVFAAG